MKENDNADLLCGFPVRWVSMYYAAFPHLACSRIICPQMKRGSCQDTYFTDEENEFMRCKTNLLFFLILFSFCSSNWVISVDLHSSLSVTLLCCLTSGQLHGDFFNFNDHTFPFQNFHLVLLFLSVFSDQSLSSYFLLIL